MRLHIDTNEGRDVPRRTALARRRPCACTSTPTKGATCHGGPRWLGGAHAPAHRHQRRARRATADRAGSAAPMRLHIDTNEGRDVPRRTALARWRPCACTSTPTKGAACHGGPRWLGGACERHNDRQQAW
ncbi:hypothetical protein PR003_g3740 [Phytophthora rubi]|uniref:Uncharacterized protein n=1 Tax=Phytophthora rubi TaxID=129364 RepID=A0A6A4G667_9STRA|nr:hypothetical protein PR003_g3740 [Phytophthora rubi]